MSFIFMLQSSSSFTFGSKVVTEGDLGILCRMWGAQEGPCTHNQMRCASSKKPMKVNGESLEKKFAPSHSTANTRSDQ